MTRLGLVSLTIIGCLAIDPALAKPKSPVPTKYNQLTKKQQNGLDQVIVLWTANTERYADIVPGINDTGDNLLKAVKDSHPEVAPSTIFAVASILEGVPFINGAPQNTFVPGCIDLAEKRKAFIAGDDFKSGQTKVKSVLAEFLVNAGIKPLSIACEFAGGREGRVSWYATGS